MSRTPARLLTSALLGLGSTLTAQCALEWSGSAQPRLSGHGRCSTLWDPDGAGPLPLRLVVGGDTLLAGGSFAGLTLPNQQRVMTWDGSTWQPLGELPGPAGSTVLSLTTWNGELVAAGSFTSPSNVVRWDGVAWQPIGLSGIAGPVAALATWNGNLIAASFFQTADFANAILRQWDGTTWTSLPSPPTLGETVAMTAFNGELIVAGKHKLTSASASQGVIERWNGTSWASSILTQNHVLSLAVRNSIAIGGTNTLFACGSFDTIGGAPIAKIAKTNGGSFTWTAVGSGITDTVTDVLPRNAGISDYTVVALQGNVSMPVIRYTSSNNTWSAFGSSELDGLAFYAGSYHGVSSHSGVAACQRYDGSQWRAVEGPGIVGEVRSATGSGNDTILGGTFASISGVPMNGITRWNGTTFTPLGTGMVGSSIDALVTLANGDVVAAGNFVAAGGVAVNHVARWNGSSWSAMGNGFDAPVHALCTMPNGDVIAGGSFTQEVGAPVLCSHVARWNGTSWSPMDFGVNDDVLALVVRSDGTLFAGGRFTQTMSTMFSLFRMARWTGTQWAQVGAGMNAPVHGLAARPNGDIVAVGEFTQAGLLPVDRCARWNGTSWLSMGAASGNPGAVHAVCALPNGDVIAGRGFHQPFTTVDGGISRWNGSTWSATKFLAGPDAITPVDVRTIVQRADGGLVLGGAFCLGGTVNQTGILPASSLTTLRSLCMPTATSYGSGCSSAAGPLVITADTLPWVGSTFRTTTSGVASGSLCIGLIGLTQLAIPLPTLLPEGQPGCSLLTSLDILLLLTNGPGNTASSAFAFTNDPALIGVPFFQQTLPFEFDLSGAVTAVRGSDALSLVIGTL